MEKEYYYYLGEVYCDWDNLEEIEFIDEERKRRTYTKKEHERHSEEVSGMVEYLEKKTPVEAYNGIVELNKIAFIEKLELTTKENPEFKMLITKLQRF